ncbi:uncharacterized protein BDV14DRAFT_170827 [Aspergillus stella-maris]|uniref:uncharacterized protein n=1 Tax=Aspergillus stella-maris TaxID=1810926 RepID=UPI003CCCE295
MMWPLPLASAALVVVAPVAVPRTMSTALVAVDSMLVVVMVGAGRATAVAARAAMTEMREAFMVNVLKSVGI